MSSATASRVSQAGVQRGPKGSMTEGGIAAPLVLFALPMLMTNFFQQFYVTVDSMIVGQWSGNVALAAVSTCAFLISTIVCFFNGLSVGAGVVLAQLFGARDTRRFGNAVWGAGMLSVVGGLAMTLLCVGLSRPCLGLMNLEGEVLEQAVLYMRTYALGMLPMVVYNMGSAVFRAHGDSRTPMLVLAASSVLNLLLACLFVIGLSMGVFGAALATACAQLFSALLTAAVVWRRREMLHIAAGCSRLDFALVRRMLVVGVPNGVQMMVICLSGVIVSSQINLYGLEAMDGYGAYTKVDGWLYMPIGSIQSAIVMFVGQNIGAGRYDRAKRGVLVGLGLAVGTTIVLCALMWAIRYPVLGMFSPDPAVIRYGVQAMAVLLPLYWVYAIYMAVCGLYYGVGSTVAPMVFALTFMCVMRIVWVLGVQAMAPSTTTIYLSYPISWCCMVAALVAYYRWGTWRYKEQIRSVPWVGRLGGDGVARA